MSGLLPEVRVTRVLPAADLSPAEVDAIVEVAYLTTVADGKLTDAEIDSFRDVVCTLRKLPALGDRELNAMFDGFAKNIAHKDVADRLLELAADLRRPEARNIAYKLSFAMALSDLATSDAEGDFDDELLDALKLSADEAEVLEGEVFAALDGEDETTSPGELN